MIATLRRLALALLAGLALAGPAHSGSYTVDLTDLWWNDPPASESGWGMNVIQQNETLFVTFFVYGQDNSPRWYVASSAAPTNPQPVGATRFSGDLYRTTGPWFGTATFDPNAVTVTKVGTLTIDFFSPTSAAVTYSVDGQVVNKTVMRQTYGLNSVAGRYIGGMHVIASACNPPSFNGNTNMLGVITVTQTTTQVSFKVEFALGNGGIGSCTFVGNYSQQGRLATVTQGTFACTPVSEVPSVGTFSMTGLDSQFNGFHATFSGRDQYCNLEGRFGGTREAGT